MANTNLQKAKTAKNDEFYTQLTDVAKELMHYKNHFKDKIVFCNCDDPTWSAFWKYFHLNFAELGLKKLISTHYDREEATYKMEYTGGDDNDIEVGVKTPLEGNGDFRNQECLDLLDESDIVCTNEPFSLFREYIAVLMDHKKKFLIIGNKNAITYKEFFPLLKNNEVWIGCNNVKEFLQPDGSIKKFGNIGWFTNLDVAKRHEKLILWKNYTPDEYPTYDNYDAINVNKVSEIPCDYCESWGVTDEELERLDASEWEVVRTTGDLHYIIPAKNTELRKMMSSQAAGYKEMIEKELGKAIYLEGAMGVPITFMDKHNPEQFEILNANDIRSNPETPAKEHGLIKDKDATIERYCNGIIGVPITFLDKYSPEQFEIFGATESEGKGFSDCLRERYCNGMLGVPITFLDKYNPEQFEIVGGSMFDDTPNIIETHYVEDGYKFLKSNGVSVSGSGALRDKMSPKIPGKGKSDYSVSPEGKCLHSIYQRIFIIKKVCV